MLGARLKQLGVPTVIVEKNAKAGNSWRNRYRSLVLHDPVWYDHLPYIPFPANWPVFTPKDKMGDWLEMYVRVMELTYWGSTQCISANFDEHEKRWTVELLRDGKSVTLSPHNSSSPPAPMARRSSSNCLEPTVSRARSSIRANIPTARNMPARRSL